MMRKLILLFAGIAVWSAVLGDPVKLPLPISIPDDAGPATRHAAQELDDYVFKITGRRGGVVSGPCEGARVTLVERPDMEDSFRLRTTDDGLVIEGGRRGILYGVYEVLETYGGVGWYSARFEVVPKADTLNVPGGIDRLEVPAFEGRWPGWFVPREKDAVWAARLRLNLGSANFPRSELGGVLYRYASGKTSHTFDLLVPLARYAKTHPEYFSEIGGERRLAMPTQLCTSNPEVIAAATSNMFAWIRSQPEAGCFTISHNDGPNYCECARCAAIDAEEGSHAGAELRFCNAIATAVAKEFPKLRFRFDAYQHSRKPPKKTRPAANVIVGLCAIECDFSRPFGTPGGTAANLALERDLEGWKALGANLLIYDYTTNYRFMLHAFPNFITLAGNMRYYRDQGVRHLYEEGSMPYNDLGWLKPWLQAKLAWNPDRKAGPLIEKFVREYYGEAAAPFVLQYIRAQQECVKAKGTWINIFEEERPTVYTDAFVEKADALWRQAEEATAKSDPTRLSNVREGRLAAIGMRLDRMVYRTKRYWASDCPNKFPAPVGADECLTWAMRWMKENDSGKPLTLCAGSGRTEYQVACWKKLLDFKRPKVGSKTCVIPAVEMQIESPGVFSEVVDDPESLTGKAVRLSPAYQNTALVQRAAHIAFDNRQYRLRLRLRVEGRKSSEGEALYLRDDHGYLKGGGVSAGSLSSKYAWHDFGKTTLTESLQYFISSGRFDHGGGFKTCEAVVIDAMELSAE